MKKYEIILNCKLKSELVMIIKRIIRHKLYKDLEVKGNLPR